MTRKSGSGWLDRIRTAKGFPEIASTDLENFLQNLPEPETPTRCPTAVPEPSRNKHQPLHSVTNVFHELFNFGYKCSNSKKAARKQANPRVCAIVENRNVAPEVLLRSGEGDNGVEGVKEVEEGEGRDLDLDLAGFSKTEVTVIDTSYECWKFDKLLFRKKNVWKVRAKKSGSVGGSMVKKRKMSVEEDECEKKKRKIDKSVADEKSPDKVRKVLKKKQPNSKMENGSSSIILIKSIPTSKKNGTSNLKSCLGK